MNEYRLRIGDREFTAQVREMTSETARIAVNGTEYSVDLVELGSSPTAAAPAARPAAPRAGTPPPAPDQPSRRPAPTTGTVNAPLPGLVLEIRAWEGASVRAGDPVLVMEAMKMENVVPAPRDGTVRKLYVGKGDSVAEGDPLAEISPPEMTTL